MPSEWSRLIAAWCKRPDVSKQDIESMMRVLLGLPELEEAEDGGKGSGNFNHAGRPGNVGGSGKGSVHESEPTAEEHQRTASPSIKKPAYRKKFDSFGESRDVTRKLYKTAFDMVQHRSATAYEDIAYIDTTRHGMMKAQTSFNEEKKCIPSREMMAMASRAMD